MSQAIFHTHVALLQNFLDRRAVIVAAIDSLLNCQKKPVEYQRDHTLLARRFRDCFFAVPVIGREQLDLAGQLEQAHWAGGFKPRQKPGNDLVDPAEMMVRGFHLWRQTRWPGQKGRLHYAHTLFNLYLLRCLALLSLRLWDLDTDHASARLARLQALLDQLWQDTPAGQPTLVRDVRWLLPVAMSPTTDTLDGYFEVAARITATFAEADRIETHRAWVLTGAGHLRSQLRHLCVQRNATLADPELVLLTRKSNALDLALLVQGLVTLLTAYEQALHGGNEQRRRELGSAICQGLSPDPELFVNRLDLLGAYSMIEHLFITIDDKGKAAYTAMGRRHRQLLAEYGALLTRLAASLHEDSRQGRPGDNDYSPYGVLYGFSSNLIELLAFKSLQREAVAGFSMEDAFACGSADQRAWVNDWRRLGHVKAEVVRQYEYPQAFAAAMHARIEQALRKRVAGEESGACGRLLVLSPETAQHAAIPALSPRFILSSDPHYVAEGKAEAMDHEDLLHCRLEGEFLACCRTPGGWVALSKDLLTAVLGTGSDAMASCLPCEVGEVLDLMLPPALEHEAVLPYPCGQ